MMSNFQNTFNRLKKERQLSNKQVASFTGVKVKDVKKWETGMSFPTDSKVVDALEGILGTEIIKSLEGFKTEENNFSSLTSCLSSPRKDQFKHNCSLNFLEG